MAKRPLILVTNDDGITAPGIRSLIAVMTTLGDVVVVAPDAPQSAMGHAITINRPLHIKKVVANGPQTEYSCSGTPADCIKIGLREVLDRKPDLCVSGINHGSNSSINVIYSGTMSAAIEAGIAGVPAVGFSLLNYSWNANFDACRSFIENISKNVIERGLPDGVVLNVNLPDLDKEAIKGVKICRQASANWVEKFDKRTNPMGKVYYWLAGDFINKDYGMDTDEWALSQGYVSVVPVQFDLTAHAAIKNLKTWPLT